ETVERTLFNPTRRPAPPQQSAASQPAFPRGQFVLTGTTVIDNTAMAFLREVNGGRSPRRAPGGTIKGGEGAQVPSQRVTRTRGGEFEELTLKAAAGPKTTIQPQVAVAPPAAPPGAPPTPQPAQQNVATPQQAGQSQDTAEVLASRRRAARAAAEAAQA